MAFSNRAVAYASELFMLVRAVLDTLTNGLYVLACAFHRVAAGSHEYDCQHGCNNLSNLQHDGSIKMRPAESGPIQTGEIAGSGVARQAACQAVLSSPTPLCVIELYRDAFVL